MGSSGTFAPVGRAGGQTAAPTSWRSVWLGKGVTNRTAMPQPKIQRSASPKAKPGRGAGELDHPESPGTECGDQNLAMGDPERTGHELSWCFGLRGASRRAAPPARRLVGPSRGFGCRRKAICAGETEIQFAGRALRTGPGFSSFQQIQDGCYNFISNKFMGCSCSGSFLI